MQSLEKLRSDHEKAFIARNGQYNEAIKDKESAEQEAKDVKAKLQELEQAKSDTERALATKTEELNTVVEAKRLVEQEVENIKAQLDTVKAENHSAITAKDDKIATLERESKETTDKLQSTLDGYKTSSDAAQKEVEQLQSQLNATKTASEEAQSTIASLKEDLSKAEAKVSESYEQSEAERTRVAADLRERMKREDEALESVVVKER